MVVVQAGFLSCTFCGGFCYVGIIGACVSLPDVVRSC
jgi:hypothetical protein